MTQTRPVPERQTLPLLDLITRQSLDEDYEHVAEQRRRGAVPPARPAARRRTTAAAVIGFGLLVSVAAVQTSRNADVDSAGRATLIERITDRRAVVTDVRERIGAVREQNDRLEGTLLSLETQFARVIDRRAQLRATTGFGVVRGEGVRFVVDDAPTGGDGRVRDADLALLVNGLWQAGARAISVNGERLTALSALRNSAEAIRVNDVSLSPPYTVLAAGDPRTLQARFAETTSGARFHDLTASLGMPFSRENVEELELPAAPSRLLRLRSVTEAAGPASPDLQEDTP